MSAQKFNAQIASWIKKVDGRTKELFVRTANHVKESIVAGDPLTGSPGQPVDTGNLRNSWQLQFESPRRALISTNVEYAPYIEDGPMYGLTLRSQVGGWNSVKMTRANFDRIVDFEAEAIGRDL